MALEVGQQSAVYRWHPERDGPLTAGSQVAIIVGEGGVVDDEGVPTARGDDQLEWWFVFQSA